MFGTLRYVYLACHLEPSHSTVPRTIQTNSGPSVNFLRQPQLLDQRPNQALQLTASFGKRPSSQLVSSFQKLLPQVCFFTQWSWSQQLERPVSTISSSHQAQSFLERSQLLPIYPPTGRHHFTLKKLPATQSYFYYPKTHRKRRGLVWVAYQHHTTPRLTQVLSSSSPTPVPHTPFTASTIACKCDTKSSIPSDSSVCVSGASGLACFLPRNQTSGSVCSQGNHSQPRGSSNTTDHGVFLAQDTASDSTPQLHFVAVSVLLREYALLWENWLTIPVYWPRAGSTASFCHLRPEFGKAPVRASQILSIKSLYIFRLSRWLAAIP